LWNIFGPLKILQLYHANFLRQLEKVLANWKQHISTVGDVFFENSAFMLLYSVYARSFAKSFIFYRQQLESNIAFAGVVTTFETYLHSNGTKVEDILRLPVNRLDVYITLLKAILKYTSKSHSDFPTLEGCIHRVTLISNTIKAYPETKQIHENSKFVAICDSIRGDDSRRLISPERKFICQGSFVITRISCSDDSNTNGEEDCVLFLFSDIIVCCRFASALQTTGRKMSSVAGPAPFANGLPSYSYDETEKSDSQDSESFSFRGGGSNHAFTRKRSFSIGLLGDSQSSPSEGRSSLSSDSPLDSSTSSSSGAGSNSYVPYVMTAKMEFHSMDRVYLQANNSKKTSLHISSIDGDLWSIYSKESNSEVKDWYKMVKERFDLLSSNRD